MWRTLLSLCFALGCSSSRMVLSSDDAGTRDTSFSRPDGFLDATNSDAPDSGPPILDPTDPRVQLTEEEAACLGLTVGGCPSCHIQDGLWVLRPVGVMAPDTPTPPARTLRECGVTDPGRLFPRRPDILDGVDTAARTFALRDIVLDQREVWEDVGWNLDGAITDDVSDEPLCIPPEGDFPPLDGRGGVDNVFGERVLATLADLYPGFEANARARMVQGETIVVRLRDWNGMNNDPNVEVIVAMAASVTRADGLPEPQWDGNDRWNVATTSFSGGNPDRPLIIDNNAYVADGRLVARMPDRQPVVIPWLETNRFQLRLTEARLSAEITDGGTRLRDVTISGRYGDIDLADALTRSGLCEGGSARDLLDRERQEDLDVRGIAGSGGPGVACTAMSFSIGFTGVGAVYGEIVEPAPEDPVDCLPDPF